MPSPRSHAHPYFQIHNKMSFGDFSLNTIIISIDLSYGTLDTPRSFNIDIYIRIVATVPLR